MSKGDDKILSLDNMEKIIDDKTPITHIYDYIIEFIKRAEKIRAYKGEAKKYYVNSRLKEILPVEVFNRFEPMLDMSIDYLVYLSKHPEILKEVNKIVKCCDKNCKGFFCCIQ